MGSFFSELKRRNVFRVGVFYVIAAWIIMQVVDVVMPALNLPEWTITLVLVLLVIGLPLALIFAWAFELTPEGLKRESEVDRSESITATTGRRIDRVIIGLLSLALVYVVINYVVPDPDATVEPTPASSSDVPNSIAVLPFVDMSQEGDQEYFADGISEELLNVLAQVQDFRVAGRTSSFQFKGQNQDIREIGRLLNVGTVLEGSIRRSGDEIRVTAQLVNVDDGFHLWSDTYDRRLDNIFQIQDEIARAVVSALKTTLLGEAAVAATVSTSTAVSTDAYELFLKGRHAWHQRTADSLAEAMEFFKEAIALDPSYAAAWSGLADTWLLSIDYSDTPREQGLAEGRRAAEAAMRLDDQLADAHASMGLYHIFAASEDLSVGPLRRAIELNPSHAMANMWLANALTTGSPEAIEQLSKARQIDPLHPVILSNYARNLMVSGDAERAVEVATEFQRLYPASGDPDSLLAELSWQQNEPVDALFFAEAAYRKSPDARNALPVLANLYMLFEDMDRASAMMDELKERYPSSIPAVFLPAALAFVSGDLDGARAHLESGWQRRQDPKPLRCFRHLPDLVRSLNLDTIVADCRLAIDETGPDIVRKFVPGLHIAVAQALELSGNEEEAMSKYEEYLAVSSETLESLPQGANERRDVLVDRARALISLNRIDEAIAAFQAAVDDGLLFARLEVIDFRRAGQLGDIPEIRAIAGQVEEKVAAMKADIQTRRAAQEAVGAAS